MLAGPSFLNCQPSSCTTCSLFQFETTCERHTLPDLLSLSPDRKKLISKLVHFFCKEPELTLSIKREKEINFVIPDKIWRTAFSLRHECSVNSRHRLIRFSVIHQFHYLLNKLYPSVSPICDKLNDGTLVHLFWNCPLVYPFLSSVFSFFSGVYHRTLSPDRDLALFGCSEESLTLAPHIQTVLLMGYGTSQKMYPYRVEGINQLHELVSVIHMEKLRFNSLNCHRKWDDSWGPSMQFLSSV